MGWEDGGDKRLMAVSLYILMHKEQTRYSRAVSFHVGEDIFHGSGDDARLVVVTCLNKGEVQHQRARINLTKVRVVPDAVFPYTNTTET